MHLGKLVAIGIQSDDHKEGGRARPSSSAYMPHTANHSHTRQRIDQPSRTVLDTRLLDMLPDASILTSIDGIVLYWNRSATRLFGWKPEEVVGQPYSARYPEPMRSWLQAEISKRAAGEDWEGEFEDYRRDGSRVWIHSTVSRILDDAGQPVAILGISRDITLRKRTEAELLESQRRLDEAQRLAHLACWSWDPTTQKVWWSDGVYDLFGLDKGQVEPSFEVFLSLLHPDDRPLAVERAQRVHAGTETAAHDLRLLRPDGKQIWIHSRSRATRDEHGNILRVEGTDQDITERKLAEQALRESEERNRILAEGLFDGLLVHDVDGKILDANSQMCQQLGYERSELIGKYPDFFDQNASPSYMADLSRRCQLGEQLHLETLHRHRDGHLFPVEVRLRSFSLLGESRSISVTRDLTEQKVLEEKYRQAHKMEAVGQLAGGVAHDFNNLLTVVRSYSELLLLRFPSGDETTEHLMAIREASERAASLTAQLLAFSRKAIIEPKVIDLNSAVDSTARLLRRIIGEDIKLVTHLAPDLWKIAIDPVQLQQTFMNLAVNARDAMPRGGLLSIATANVTLPNHQWPETALCNPGSYVQLCVSDNGHGMSEEVKRHLFEPFFTTKGAGKGTGLGLATIYGIVHQAAGFIGVESEPGNGATFRIYLPAVMTPQATRDTFDNSATMRGNETVLLVEDEQAVRQLAKLILEMHGYQVIAASCAAEALAAIQMHAGKIDLLLSDIVMPDLPGRELAEKIRQIRADLRVLYMSGYTNDALMRSGVATAADWFLAKPFTPASLTQKVRAVLDA